MSHKGVGKLGAYQTKGGRGWDAAEDENVLYLGAAQGKTAQWMSYLVPDGQILAVEKSPVAGLGLLKVSQKEENVIPYLGDARRPDTYGPTVPPLGLVYQDVAQRDQIDIFVRNMRAFDARRGLLAVKARSIAVEKPPSQVIEEAVEQLKDEGFWIVDVQRLDPFHKDHAMIVVDPPDR